MKRVILIFVFIFALLAIGCSVNTSGNVDVDPDDFKYVQDSRTDLCYAVVASRKAMQADTTGLGVTNVPCTEEVLAQVE